MIDEFRKTIANISCEVRELAIVAILSGVLSISGIEHDYKLNIYVFRWINSYNLYSNASYRLELDKHMY